MGRRKVMEVREEERRGGGKTGERRGLKWTEDI